MTGLGSAPVIAFAATTRPAEAIVFYEESLGLRLVADEPFAVVLDAGGTMLRLTKVAGLVPAPRTVLGWQVADVRASVTELRTRNVAFEKSEGLDQDDCDVWAAPGGALVAWFRDPDGNLLSLTQFS